MINKVANKAARSVANLLILHHLPDTELDSLRWLMRLRVRIGLLLMLVLVSVYFVQPLPVLTMFGLVLTDITYLGFSVLYSHLLVGSRAERYAPLVLRIQLPEKLILCTLALYFSGGVLTPTFLLYSLAIVEAILLMRPQGVYRTGAWAVLLYCTLSLLESARLIPHFPSYFGAQSYYDFASTTTYALHVLFVTTLTMLAAYMGSRVADLLRHRNTLIERQLEDLETLYGISEGIANTTNEAEALDLLATTLKETQDAAMCLIALKNRDGRLELAAQAGIGSEAADRLREFDLNSPAFSSLLTSGTAVLLDEGSKYPELREWAHLEGIASAYFLPLRAEAGGPLLGVVVLLYPSKIQVGEPTQNLLASAASQTGLFLARSRALADAQRAAQEMSELYGVGLQMASTLSRTEILERTSSGIERLMNPDLYYIALYSEETDIISFEKFVERGESLNMPPTHIDDGGLTALIISTQQPLLIQDWLRDGQSYNSIAHRAGTDMLSYLGVPIMLNNRVLGVLSVQCARPNAFDAQDQRFLSAMAAQTALALENARLHADARAQAQNDSLTQVYNHGAFIERVREAIDAAQRDGTEVALIMLDIDHFKRYNDSFGHVAGDNVLKLVASALKANSRMGDYVGRWGGEEFGVLLVNAGLEEGKMVARRIRRAILELRPVDGLGKYIPNPTISQGLSVYPHPCASASDLIESADLALYHAKEQGRNQLVVMEAHNLVREATHTTDNLRHSSPRLISSRTRPLDLRDSQFLTTGNLARKTITKQLS